MTFEDAYFKQKILKQDSLEPFGFTTTEQGYEFRKTLIADELEARLLIDLEGKLTGQVVDIDLDEPYDIFRSPQATGTYVGQVREAYGELLSQLADSCYENQLFSSPQANRLAQFLVQEFSDQADHPFEKEPSYLSFRVDGKWYALFFPLKGEKLGLTIGFSVGMGGFGVTILGFIADNFGLPLVMQIVTWLPVAAAIIALKIPIPASLRK